jgi:hypothetical protein
MRPQCKEVLHILRMMPRTGITSKDALRMIGCARLASRIHDLRDEGYKISVETVKVRHGVHVARYRLTPGQSGDTI